MRTTPATGVMKGNSWKIRLLPIRFLPKAIDPSVYRTNTRGHRFALHGEQIQIQQSPSLYTSDVGDQPTRHPRQALLCFHSSISHVMPQVDGFYRLVCWLHPLEVGKVRRQRWQPGLGHCLLLVPPLLISFALIQLQIVRPLCVIEMLRC